LPPNRAKQNRQAAAGKPDRKGFTQKEPEMTDASPKAKSQLTAILAHLKRHGRIDMPTAWDFYGCAALRSRISDLRKQGVGIETRYVAFTSRFGHPGRYAVYHLQGFEKKLVEKSLLFH